MSPARLVTVVLAPHNQKLPVVSIKIFAELEPVPVDDMVAKP